MADIVIVGGGITGATTAYWLAAAGYKPQLFEAHTIAAMGSGWSLGGVRQSGRDPAELPLAQAAVALWPKLAELLDGATEYRQRGNLRLARTEAEVGVIRKLVADQRALGLDLTFLPTTADARELAPKLSDRVLAASVCPTDGHANPALTTQTFANAAKRAGATIRESVSVARIVVEGGRVAGIETSAGRIPADVVVVAAGVQTPALLAPLGLELPMATYVVNVIQTEPLPPVLDQVLGVANANCAARQQADGRLRYTSGKGPWAGDTARWRDENLTPHQDEVANIKSIVANILPVAGEAAITNTWGGLIDLTPDALPVIDRPEAIGGLVIGAGFSGHGFGIGPITGQLLADLASSRSPSLAVNAFRLGRFKERTGPAAPLTLHG